MSFDYLFKVILVGDTEIGKPNILLQFCERKFKQPVQPLSIGVEFGARTITLEDKQIKLQIWDTAGQEYFRSITRSYYRGCAGILLVYDITKKESFLHLKEWLKDCKKHSNSITTTILLIGNKVDLNNRREVPTEEARKFSEQNKLDGFFEVSAKTGLNIDKSFISLSELIMKKIKNKIIDTTDENHGVKLGKK